MTPGGARRPVPGWAVLVAMALGGAAPCSAAQAPAPADTLALAWTISSQVVRAGERLVVRAAAPIPGPGWRLAGPAPGTAGSVDILAGGPVPAGAESTAWRIKGPHGAAARLDLQPSTLYSRMQRLGIPHRRQKDAMS